MKLKFRSWNCRTVWARYPNGALALQLVADGDQPEHEIHDGEPIARASVNIVERGAVPDGQIIIKTWAENQGIEYALMTGGVLRPSDLPLEFIQAGYEAAEVHELTDAARAEVAAYDAGGLTAAAVAPAPITDTARAADSIVGDSEGGECD